MTYQGSCHCGQNTFEVDGQLDEVVECNCSICAKRGTLLWFVPRASLRLNSPEDKLAAYTFNKRVIQHRFCPACGCALYGEGQAPDGKPMAAINVRCLDEVDLSTLKVNAFDGRSL